MRVRLVMLGLLAVVPAAGAAGQAAESSWRVVERQRLEDAERAEVTVQVHRVRGGGAAEGEADREGLPVRAIVTGADGSHADGSGHGTYADGRFFADGRFEVVVPPGETSIELRSGPNHLPLAFEVDAEAGRRTIIVAELAEWFRPERRGWYAGDNHVHAQHDARAAVSTGLEYMALQARANGLSFVTEAGSNVSYKLIDRLDRDDFLLRYAPELRPGPFAGHLNTPGLAEPFGEDEYDALIRRPLPARAVVEAVHERGGAVIHTHPTTPVHQLHWMGAAELLSDAVLGRTAHLLDQDTEATRTLWFAALNLGNRIGASGSTDAALGRVRTLSPGDRRVYARADELDYDAIVRALRTGRTFATNGGPLFASLEIEGRGPGETIKVSERREGEARVELRSLHALRRARLFRRGQPVHDLDIAGQRGEARATADLDLRPGDWYVLRAEDAEGHWAMTSPIYVEGAEPEPRPASSAILLQVSNADRFTNLTRRFFAHVIATVSPERAIERVELLKDGRPIRAFTPDEGDRLHEGRIPVTQIRGPYGKGWMWHAEAGRPVHLQADWPVDETGWYSVRIRTSDGEAVESDALRFDAANPNSHQLSVANLAGGDTALSWHGYGEEMPLDQITDPFEGDHWWYPRNTYWRMAGRFGEHRFDIGPGPHREQAGLFRAGR